MERGEYLQADVELIDEPGADPRESEALVRTVMNQFEQYVKVSKKVPQEVLSSLSSIDDPAGSSTPLPPRCHCRSKTSNPF